MDRTFVAVGGLINSALYLGGLVAVAVGLHHPVVAILALASAGFAVLSYQAALVNGRLSTIILHAISNGLGAGAGLALIIVSIGR